MRRHPNLIIFVADEYRGDALGHLGTPGCVTPVLDELVATDAVSFSRTFCQNPVCVPSRASLLTGWYPHVRGHRTQGFPLQVDEPNLLHRLTELGYDVWWAGKNDALSPAALSESGAIRASADHTIGSTPAQPRVDNWHRWWGEPDTPGYYSHYVGRLDDSCRDDQDQRWVDQAVRQIESRGEGDEPWCILLTVLTPHCPYAVTEPWYSLIPREQVAEPIPVPPDLGEKPRAHAELRRRQGLSGWNPGQWRELRATYLGMCARTDALFGQVISALRRSGSYDDTLCVFTADHGDFAGDYGLPEKAQNLFEDVLVRVPLVIKPPRGEGAHGVSEAMVELIDVLATVEDLCGIPRDYVHFGRSLLTCLRDPGAPHRQDVMCEGGRLPGESAAMELAAPADPTGLYYPRMMLQREDSIAHGKGVMLRTAGHKYVYRLLEPDELYDLRVDPDEMRNVISDPAQRDYLEQLRARLLDRMIETADFVPMRENHR